MYCVVMYCRLYLLWYSFLTLTAYYHNLRQARVALLKTNENPMSPIKQTLLVTFKYFSFKMLPSDLVQLGIYSVAEAIYFLFLINGPLGTLDSYSRISSLVTFEVFPLSSYNTTLLFHYEMGSKLRACPVRLQFKKDNNLMGLIFVNVLWPLLFSNWLWSAPLLQPE